MEEMVELKVLVSKAEAALYKVGVKAELTTRRKNGTLRKFAKCKIAEMKDIDSSKANDILDGILKVSKQNAVDMGALRDSMSGVKNQLGNLTDMAKDMAVNVDQIFKTTNVAKALSYVNVGLSLANLAVDVAGFVVVCKKINELNVRIQELSDKIDRIEKLETNKLIKESRDYALQSNSLLEKISLGEEVDLDSYEEFINKFTNYLNLVIDCIGDNSVDMEILLTVFNYLMPSYTLATCEFIDRYYFKKGLVPSNYKSYLNLFDRLGSEDYIRRLEDFFFFEEKLGTLDTIDAVNAQIFIALNGRVQLEDQVEILTSLKTKEKIMEFKKALDEYAEVSFNATFDKHSILMEA